MDGVFWVRVREQKRVKAFVVMSQSTVGKATPTLCSEDQKLGVLLPEWQPRALPDRNVLEGRYCNLEPLVVSQHAAELFEEHQQTPDGSSWTYLPYGPFVDFESYREWLVKQELSQDPLFFVVRPRSKSCRASGLTSFMRMEPSHGVIELGHVHFAPSMQRTAASTECLYLMLRRVFELGYRRCEWKCDSLNQPSRDSARRLGFTYEGTFRQAVVVKKRNRDTAWFSIIDREWPGIRLAFERWLDASNFDVNGAQRERLNTWEGRP